MHVSQEIKRLLKAFEIIFESGFRIEPEHQAQVFTYVFSWTYGQSGVWISDNHSGHSNFKEHQ